MLYTFIFPVKTFIANLCHFCCSTFVFSNIIVRVKYKVLFLDLCITAICKLIYILVLLSIFHTMFQRSYALAICVYLFVPILDSLHDAY